MRQKQTMLQKINHCIEMNTNKILVPNFVAKTVSK